MPFELDKGLIVIISHIVFFCSLLKRMDNDVPSSSKAGSQVYLVFE